MGRARALGEAVRTISVFCLTAFFLLAGISITKFATFYVDNGINTSCGWRGIDGVV
jgi:hypothetical protein